MDDAYLQRFSRHILLDEVGIEGQAAFRQSHVVVVGAGGLGCPTALYLVAAGLGKLTLVDDDTVDLSNLQRQILHTDLRVGQAKVSSAAEALQAISGVTELNPLHTRLDMAMARQLFASADLVVDCSDNFPTRYLVNAVCQSLRKPLVSGSAIRFSGQIAVFDFAHTPSPCYHCLFPDGDSVEELRCAVTGVFAPVTGVIGTLLAGEVLKMLLRNLNTGPSVVGLSDFLPFFLRFDGLRTLFSRTRIVADPTCPVCH